MGRVHSWRERLLEGIWVLDLAALSTLVGMVALVVAFLGFGLFDHDSPEGKIRHTCGIWLLARNHAGRCAANLEIHGRRPREGDAVVFSRVRCPLGLPGEETYVLDPSGSGKTVCVIHDLGRGPGEGFLGGEAGKTAIEARLRALDPLLEAGCRRCEMSRQAKALFLGVWAVCFLLGLWLVPRRRCPEPELADAVSPTEKTPAGGAEQGSLS